MIENLKSQIEMRRAQKNMTIKDLEIRSGLKTNAILNLLISKVKSPKVDTVVKLANFFECSVDELLGNQPETLYSEIKNEPLFKGCLLSCWHYFELKKNKIVPNKFFEFVQKVYIYSLENNLNQPDQGYIRGLGERKK